MAPSIPSNVTYSRALVTEPQVLLLDEPLSAIDAQLRKSLQQSIRDIQQRLNITTIFVTHDQNESMIMSDRIAILNQGRIEQVDTPINLYTKPRTEFVANFLGNYNVIQAKDYTDMTGEHCPSTVAIRPEAILIQDQVPTLDSETYVVLQGHVRERIPKGNILAYTMEVGGHQLKVDSLFRTHNLYEIDQTVYASFERRNILSLEG